MKTLICAAIMAAFCFASAAFAQQQHPCGPQDDVAKVLASQYDEHPVEAGAANGALVVLFASNGGGDVEPGRHAAERHGLPRGVRRGMAGAPGGARSVQG